MRFFDPLLDRLDVFPRNRSTDDLILKNETGSDSARLDGNPNMTVLAAAAGLADVLAFRIGLLANGFLVRHLRLADIGADIELAHHAVDDDFQMKFAHSGNDRLAGIRIRVDPECRIFLRQLVQRDAHLFLIGLGLRLDGDGNDRLREIHRFEKDLLVLIADRVARRDIAQTDSSSDVAGETRL